MEDFKDLRVWEKAPGLTLSVYKKTHGFPKEEIYGLTSQLRRATISIGANSGGFHGVGKYGARNPENAGISGSAPVSSDHS